jgi:H+/Cl- antiporter ClcA
MRKIASDRTGDEDIRKVSPSGIFWASLGWGLLVGVLAAIAALIFISIMNWGVGLLWQDQSKIMPFTGSWLTVVIMTTAGFLVGLIHHYTNAEIVPFAKVIVDGHLNPKVVPAAILISMVSLVGGFSVGPEAPCGMLAGGVATWISERFKLGKDLERSNVLSGMMGSFGGLFTAPFAFLLLPLELPHRQKQSYYGTLMVASASAVLGFLLFFAVGGDRFSGLLRSLDFPEFSLRIWHLGLAVILGLLGALLSRIYRFMDSGFKYILAPLSNYPVWRGTSVGLLIGVMAMILPLILFGGSDQLATISKAGTTIGVGLIILVLFAKMLATAGALSAGFFGGEIIPFLAIGGIAGTSVSLIFPEIPQALIVGCMMAAVPSARLGLPFFFGIIVLLLTGIPPTEAIVVFIAGLTAYAVAHPNTFRLESGE